MWKQALFLILTVLVVPSLAIYLEPPLDAQTKTVLISLVQIYIAATVLCFVVSTVARNYSQVDKLWSIMPIIYAWVACAMLEFDPRAILMAVLVSIWGARLTFNFARRGGYSWRFWEGEEDYRWAEVRKRPGFSNPIAWSLFNLVFISFYQMGLILLFTLPIVKAANGTGLGFADAGLAALFLLFVYGEAVADRQQWDFQTEKYRRLGQGAPLEEYAHGFVNQGLWSKMRHPNYTCEQALWLTFYLFTVVATGQWLNWTITGSVLLLVLFYNSSGLSEEISSLKYPEYKSYQESVPRFIPSLR